MTKTISRKTNTLIIIAGPTASGKTSAAIELAQHFGTEIISADSRQIYKECSIGTAVPSPEQLRAIKHHFIQEKSLLEYYNASMYEMEVLERLESLFSRHQKVVMAGGSGLYINAVCFGIDELPTIDPEVRKTMAERLKNEGLATLQEELKLKDPISYERIDLNNHFRVLKALEVFHQTGKSYSSFLTNTHQTRDFNIIRVGLDMEREELYRRINNRVDEMMDQGLLEEVISLLEYRELNTMKTVGYRELFRYLDKELSLEEAVDLIKRNSRKYARKQLTWFRKDQLFPWFEPDQTQEILDYIEKQEENTPNFYRK